MSQGLVCLTLGIFRPGIRGLSRAFFLRILRKRKEQSEGFPRDKFWVLQMRGQALTMQGGSLPGSDSKPSRDPEEKAEPPSLCPDPCGCRCGPCASWARRVSGPSLPTDQGAGLGFRNGGQEPGSQSGGDRAR